MSLFPIQSAALLEIEACKGGLFPVGVGHGKTLISLLASEACQAERPLLLVPPSLKDQLLRVDVPRYAEQFTFRVPHVVSYSELSNKRTADALERLNPDLIVADEAHCLKHPGAARTKRFLRFARGRPDLMFVALSGTMTSKSLRDYAHLAELALDELSPLPRNWNVLEDWCAALDPGVEFEAKPGALVRLCIKESHDHSNVRDRFRCRLVGSLGVVATSESAIGTSLIIRGRIPGGVVRGNEAVGGVRPDGRYDDEDRKSDTGLFEDGQATSGGCSGLPPAVSQALARLRETWTRPDGEELEDAIAFWRVAQQIAQGFFLRWAWPKEEVDHEWLSARAAWHQESRAYLGRHSRAGCDSADLYRCAVEAGQIASGAWGAWRTVMDRPVPPTEIVWLSDFLLEDAAEFLKGGGIVWANHPVVGERLAEVSGCPFYGGGEDKAVNDTKESAIILSLGAHHKGKNLQDRHSRMLFLSVPGNEIMEQAIGRCHRPGQQADEVHVEIYQHTVELRERWARVLEEAAYVETTMQKQKLLMATRINC